MNASDSKCVNYDYCKNVVWVHTEKDHSVFCEPCKKLVDEILHKSTAAEECPVCYTAKDEYWIFPGCRLNHAFCVDCLDLLLIGEAYVCGSLCTYAAKTFERYANQDKSTPRSVCGGNIMILPDEEAVVVRARCPLCAANEH